MMYEQFMIVVVDDVVILWYVHAISFLMVLGVWMDRQWQV
jgi:hypothetical protein